MTDNTELEEVMKITGKAPTSCSCEKCANMCRRSPCLGTPQDILRLIDNGYADHIGPVQWGAGLIVGIPIIPMLQINKKKDGSCELFKDGLCPLHENGLKPIEGKLAHHSNCPDPTKTHVSIVIAKSWITLKNEKTIFEICDKLNAHLKTKKKNATTETK